MIEKLDNSLSLGLSLGSVLGGMADAGGPYCEDELIWGKGSYLFSTGLTFSTDSTLQYTDTNDTTYPSLAGVTNNLLTGHKVALNWKIFEFFPHFPFLKYIGLQL